VAALLAALLAADAAEDAALVALETTPLVASCVLEQLTANVAVTARQAAATVERRRISFTGAGYLVVDRNSTQNRMSRFPRRASP